MGLCNDKGKSFLVSTEIRNIFLEVYKKKKKKVNNESVYIFRPSRQQCSDRKN